MRKTIRVLSAIVAAGAVCSLCSTGLAAEPISVPLGQRQLFLDDHGVAKIENLARTMHQPEKKGAVIWPDRPWETALQALCAPAWDEQAGLYKMWMLTSTRDKDPANPGVNPGGTTYAESVDGIHWTKPILRQWELWGSLENNFLSFEMKSLFNALCDPKDPDPSRRFKGFLGASGRAPAVSPDGIHWTQLDVPSLPSQDHSNLSYDHLTETFIATLKMTGPHGRSHAIWTSKDFETWTNTNCCFHADDEDQRLGLERIKARFADPNLYHPAYNIPSTYNVDVYNMGLFRYEGLYIGMPCMYHQTGKVPADWPGFDKMPIWPPMLKHYRRDGDWSGFQELQLVCSRDLKHWRRLGNRKPFISHSPPGSGAWDLAITRPPSFPIVRGDELWFYYTGARYYGPVLTKEDGSGPRPACAVCLAVLRRDGFISLDAGEKPGTLVTKPFVASGAKLLVNVDATAGGDLTVEVLDGDGKVVVVSEPIVGDEPRAVVQWKSGDWAALEGQTASLRFKLREASLYSFWMEN